MDGEWEPAKIENPKCKEASGMNLHLILYLVFFDAF